MRFLPFLLLAAILALGCEPSGSGDPRNRPDTIPEPEPKRLPIPQFASPEGAVWDGNYLYVSNVGPELEPMRKDGDGYILRLNAAGTEWLDSAAFSKIRLDAPKGMAIVQKTLYVADIDRLVAINLIAPDTLFSIDFSRFATQFLNDVTLKNDSTLYVGATDINTIFEVDLKGRSFVPLKVKGLNGPNGLLYNSEEDKLYCVEYGSEKAKGRVVRIDPNTGKLEVLHKHEGGLDGLVRLRNGDLAFTDWDTKSVHRLDLRSGELTTLSTDSIMGPADIAYSPAEARLWIPRMMENKLTVLENIQ